MSSVANLFNIPDTQQRWDEWSFSLQSNLRDINTRILQLSNIQIPEYILDPFNFREPGDQLTQLQVWMNDITGVLGVAGYDFVDVNLSDKGELGEWIFLLSTKVRDINTELGI